MRLRPIGDWDGESYRAASSQQRAWGMELIELLDPRPGDVILDAGCGDGTLTREIARRTGPDGLVAGIDGSPSMIETALRGAPANTRFAVRRIEEIDEADRYDAVFSNAVLHWVVDQELAVRNIRRALKPGGRVVAEFGAAGNCREFFETADRVAIAEFGGAHTVSPKATQNRFSTAREFSAILRQAGFRRRRVLWRGRPARFGSREALEAWFATTNHGYFAPVAPGLRGRLLQRVSEEYGARANVRAGRWTVRFVRLVALAVK